MTAEQRFFEAARPHRGMLMACVVGAALLQVIDSTIANVALPHMQGTLSTTTDQISWVLTSYLIASAVMMPAMSWLAGHFGRRRLMLVCIGGFTLGSMLCGTANSLDEMVIFRVVQGVFGAGLLPLSQAIVLDMYTPSERGRAMAIWTVGIMAGPVAGPTLGAWLTEIYSWRYVFYVNLPLGLAGLVGMWLFLPATELDRTHKFDWTGFLALALGLTGLQLVLDRGQTKEWFSSTEIVAEALLSAIGFYIFLVQTLLAKRPFVSRAVFADRNFSAGICLQFLIGFMVTSSAALMPPYFQGLANYPVLTSGLAMAPRACGTILITPIVSRLINAVDPRAMVTVGLAMLATTSWMMAQWTPDVPIAAQIPVLLGQGASVAFIFAPLQMLAFATVPAILRTEASGLMAVARSMGGAVGVAVLETMLARNTQVAHQDLARFVTPFNRALQSGAPLHFWGLGSAARLAALDQMVNYNAQVVAFADDFFTMAIIILPASLLVLLMRRPAAVRAAPGEVHAAVD